MGKSEIIDHIRANIIGRIANKVGDRETDNVRVLLDFVERAGGGNHLEIGVLHGATAIAVALLKKTLDHSGIVLAVDPLNGYYYKYAPREDAIDAQSGVPVTPETLFRNLEIFDVQNRVAVLRTDSTLLPKVTGWSFTTAYIDGDHRDGVPIKDWKYVRDIVTKYVIFDNCADTHPDVVSACLKAVQDGDWRCAYDEDITFVVERVFR